MEFKNVALSVTSLWLSILSVKWKWQNHWSQLGGIKWHVTWACGTQQVLYKYFYATIECTYLHFDLTLRRILYLKNTEGILICFILKLEIYMIMIVMLERLPLGIPVNNFIIWMILFDLYITTAHFPLIQYSALRGVTKNEKG